MTNINELAEGASFGGYTLERRIREDGAAAIFAVVTNDGERLLLKLLPEDYPGAERQYAIWERSRHLRHPNLVAVRDVERSDGYVGVVFEYPDDILATALEQGPLSEAETRDVLQAALAGLRYLHAQGMVHGALVSNQIVAVGDTVKLSTDGLREPDDLGGYAEDVRQLGELVRTLRAPQPLDEPLATIVRRATVQDRLQRWTLTEIARALEPASAVPVAPPRIPAVPVAPPQIPAVPVLPSPAPRAVREESELTGPGGVPKWIFAGVAVLLLLILVFNLRRKPESPIAGRSRPSVENAAATSITPPIAPPAAIPKPVVPSSSARVASAGPSVWRVIAFTFRSYDLASKRAKQINTRWESLHATVFAPKELRGYYLVALGDRMSRNDAVQLQRKARRMGLPRDTFIQNYNE